MAAPQTLPSAGLSSASVLPVHVCSRPYLSFSNVLCLIFRFLQIQNIAPHQVIAPFVTEKHNIFITLLFLIFILFYFFKHTVCTKCVLCYMSLLWMIYVDSAVLWAQLVLSCAFFLSVQIDCEVQHFESKSNVPKGTIMDDNG